MSIGPNCREPKERPRCDHGGVILASAEAAGNDLGLCEQRDGHLGLNYRNRITGQAHKCGVLRADTSATER